MTTLGAKEVAAKTPLAVDLDGTLIRGDLFIEALLRYFFAAPWKLPILLGWLMRGRGYTKARLAERVPCDPSTLPYDARVVEWLKAERAGGRVLILATASDRCEAERVAAHLGLFDHVLGSDERVNLKSKRKAERLSALFAQGFAYAGNESADVKVWAAATSVVVANASPGLARRAREAFTVEQDFPAEGGGFRAFIKAIRPQQWAKNLLVFLPMLVGQGWLNTHAWTQAFIAFWALSFAASSVYLVNDASDIDADRRHARKRKRPFASGALSPAFGLAAAIILFIAGLVLGNIAGVLPLVGIYLATSTLYTFWLKRVVLVDVFLLASLYTIRVILGGAATGYLASDWLLAFSCFFFLSLALVKRVAEVDALQARGGGELSRRSYFGSDGAILKMMGVSAGFVAALVLALYLQNSEIARHYREPFMLWALPAAVVFWICRIWLMADRGEMHDDPLVFAFRDRTSWAVAIVTGAAFAAAVLLPLNSLPF